MHWKVKFLRSCLPTTRDSKYLKIIRQLPCVVCFSKPCEAAHVRIGTDGGTSLKPSDRYCVPLCNKHHREQHNTGEHIFWDKLNINPVELCNKLYSNKDNPHIKNIILRTRHNLEI